MKPISGGTGVEIALLAVAVVAAGVAAYGAYSAAEEQRAQLKENASRKREDADQMEEAGREAAKRQRKSDQARQESFGSLAAARGTEAHAGSALIAEMDFAEQSELQAQNVQHGYKLQARADRQAATDMMWQRGKISPTMEMGKSLMQSAGSIAGSYGTSGMGGPTAQTGGGLTSSPTSGAAYSSYRIGERDRSPYKPTGVSY
jgi:hypothetical protein